MPETPRRTPRIGSAPTTRTYVSVGTDPKKRYHKRCAVLASRRLKQTQPAGGGEEREARRDEAERILREHGRLFLGMLTTPNGTNWSANTRAVIEQAIAALKQFDARKGTP